MFKFYSLSLLFNPVLLSRDSPRVLILCLPVQVRCPLLVHKVKQIKFRLLQVNFVCIISYFLSTISFSLQLHFKQPWVRGKSLRGFSLAAMTALLMSCSPSWPMAKMLLLTSLLSILFNNNLLEVVREEEKGVQHAFNIKMGKYSDRCEAEGILFSWRL